MNKENIIPFFIGLLEGDGSIQVNHWKLKYLQFRMIIKLKNLKDNYKMLINISKTIGGKVRLTNKKKFVIWVVDDKNEIERILEEIKIYPLFTSRKICQKKFIKNCLKNNNIEYYLENKNKKYEQLEDILKSKPFKKSINTEYFKKWLAGFTEAEGCFSIRKNNNHSFSLSQKNEIYLMEEIKKILKASNKIRRTKDNMYILEIYKKETLLEIKEFFKEHPLLGEKKNSFIIFYKQEKFK